MNKDSVKNLMGIFLLFTALGIIIIGLNIAVLVIVARDHSPSNNISPYNMATTVRLNNGKEFPIVGLGTAYMTSDQARESLLAAIDRGYRHVDTAHIYETEVGVGEAINAKIAEGVIIREEIFVTSKLWRTFMAPNLVRGAVMESLTQLNLSYVDLYLIHWPMSDPESTDFDLLDTWRALEEVVDEGLIKSIGFSNFNATQVDYIVDNARIKPAVNQVESHPHCLNKQVIRHCLSRDIAVTAFSPLGSPGNPQFNSDSRRAINEVRIRAVAEKHQRTPAQVMIRYQIQQGVVAIPKTETNDRVITNFDVFNFNLSDEDIQQIESVGYHYRTSTWNGGNTDGLHQWPFATIECF